MTRLYEVGQQPPFDEYEPPPDDDYQRNGFSRDEPPQDAQAEQAVLGSMLLSRNAIADVITRVSADDLYVPAHPIIFSAIADMYGRGDPVDPITVTAELDARNQLRRIGGAPYLLTLTEVTPTAVNADYYARIVQDKARLRALISTGTTLRQYGYSGATDDDVAETINRAITALTDTQTAAPQTTWTPVNLAPYLDGDIQLPQPTIGIRRTDGQRFIYPGCDHSVIGATESGKSWFVSGCAAAELLNERRVVYIHFEEPDPISTIERLRLLGVDDALLDPRVDTCRFAFVGPVEPPNQALVQALCNPAPALVILDGVNEAISMLGGETNNVESASAFRRQLVTPFMLAGAAVISCDHVPHNTDGGRTAAIGSVHKGNTLSGARILIENSQPFGRGTRGVSNVFVTKDRPGFLRATGRPSKVPGKTFVGSLVVDEATPEYMMLFAPSARDQRDSDEPDPVRELANTVRDVIAAQPDQTVNGWRALLATLRVNKVKFSNTKAQDALDLLIADGTVTETRKGQSRSYRIAATDSEESDDGQP